MRGTRTLSRLILTALSLAAGSLTAQPTAPFAALTLAVGATSTWSQIDSGTGTTETPLEDNRPSLGGSVLAGVTLGGRFRAAAAGSAIWLATQTQGPELALGAGAHFEYLVPPVGAYYLFGQTGLCWHVADLWDSGRSAAWAPGFALGAGYRPASWLSIEAQCSFTGYDTSGDTRYRHLSILAGLRAALP